MKYTGRIVAILICLLFGFIQFIFFREKLLAEFIHQVIGLSLAWFLGGQYDKAKHYAKQLQEINKKYQELMEFKARVSEKLLEESQQRYQSLFMNSRLLPFMSFCLLML
jgi:hypothetical protein